MIAVTTFPPWAWGVYAEHCLRSWTRFWPGSILAYFELGAPPDRMPGVEFRSLDALPDRSKFLDGYFPEPGSYLHDANRFCHKVFAQLDALQTNDRIWWLDADVEAVARVPGDLIDRISRESFTAYLGRNTYTETGVLAFNKVHPYFSTFHDRYRDLYMSRDIMRLPYQTDCHAFDYARSGLGGYNMTPNGYGVNNVLEDSELGPYLVHHKGNRKLTLMERSANESV